MPVADLLPTVIGYGGDDLEETGLEHGGWVLQRLGGPPLDPESTLDSLGLRDHDNVNPSGGSLAANPVMVAGLTRIGEVAQRIMDGDATRGLAHATSGPCLQQNLVCVLEGEAA